MNDYDSADAASSTDEEPTDCESAVATVCAHHAEEFRVVRRLHEVSA